MTWQTMQSAPRDGTEVLLRYPKQGNVKHLASYDTFSGMWTNKGAPVFAIEQGCEWAPIPPDAAPVVANAAPELPEPLEEVRGKFRGEWDYVEAGARYYTQAQLIAYGQSCAAIAAQQAAPKQGLTDEQITSARDAVAEALGDAYDCLRVWSAWGVGTMGPDDFSLIAEDEERLMEITMAALSAVGVTL